QTAGRVTDVVIGMGTGGPITGVGRYLKEKNPKIRIVGVDPYGSILYETHKLGRVPDNPQPRTYKLEGIGEDFMPQALDLSVVDEVLQVGDKETFLTTRRLVREEGLFAGGSCGAAVAGALRYCRNFGPERLVVVILPDSGSRYLSKVFDDDWMRENGFLESAWTSATAADVLATKKIRDVITARPDASVNAVVAKMKEHDISQVPIVTPAGELRGMATEVELLNHLVLDSHRHSPDEPISDLMRTDVATIAPDASLESLMSVFVNRNAAVMLDGGRVVGILTKIDILDYLASH
ncbi:MAG: pyridoxal-phosphate dependent enzyme, partial [Anaerolineales bacterium]